MKEKITLKQTFIETINFIVVFFKRIPITDSLMQLPADVNKMGIRLGVYSSITTLIALVFSYLLRVSNVLIEKNLVIFAIFVFCLYQGQDVLRTLLNNRNQELQKQYQEVFDNAIILRGGELISKTVDKVVKYDDDAKIYRVLNSEEVMNCGKSYLSSLWDIKNSHRFQMIELIETIGMLVVAIVTNTEVNQQIFIPTIVIFSIVIFISSAYVSLNSRNYWSNQKTLQNTISTTSNDLMRVPLIIPLDLKMRLSKLKETNFKTRENIRDFNKSRNAIYLVNSVIEVGSLIVIIIIYLKSCGFENITLATLTETTAMVTIVKSALENVSRMANVLNSHKENVIKMQREESDIHLILETYHKEVEYQQSSKPVDRVTLKPFEVSYFEESENDKAFTLVSNQKIEISKGQIAILYGPSGSGKSTFMKMLTGRISLEKSEELPSTSRFLFYDEKLKFGSLSLYEEIFCSSKNPDLEKMKEIMRELHLWQELERNCHDVWTWLKEKHQNSNGPLSNGQNQRLILAKMLYWLDESVDVLVLDECTSGLDATGGKEESADAQKILEYVVRYANRDKKRICVISTHQNVDSFKKSVSDDFDILALQFGRHGDRNVITM